MWHRQLFRIDAFTSGTLAPNANDIELRVNTTDANGKALGRKDIVIGLKAFERAVESGSIFTTTPPL